MFDIPESKGALRRKISKGSINSVNPSYPTTFPIEESIKDRIKHGSNKCTVPAKGMPVVYMQLALKGEGAYA
jgi:hypothetical protein